MLSTILLTATNSQNGTQWLLSVNEKSAQNSPLELSRVTNHQYYRPLNFYMHNVGGNTHIIAYNV